MYAERHFDVQYTGFFGCEPTSINLAMIIPDPPQALLLCTSEITKAVHLP